MGWLGPELEPGERVVLRSPSLWWQWSLPIGWVLFPAFIWVCINLLGGEPYPNDAQDWLMLEIFAGQGAIFGGLYFLQYRWRVMVTDRRLIVREGWLRREVKIIPLDRIDGLRPAEIRSGLDILCGDETHAVEDGFLDFNSLHKALGLPDRRGTIYETNLRRILAPGERIVTRQASGFWGGWWVVTTRRFLYHDPAGPVEAMNLEDIEQATRQRYVPEITLRGDGREIAVRCFDDDADRIFAALGRNPEEAMS